MNIRPLTDDSGYTCALEAAARAHLLAAVSQATGHTVGCICQRCEDLTAAAPYLIAEGRRQASDAIVEHMDRHAPQGGNFAQQRLRRHLEIAARVALPDLTDEDRREIGERLAEMLRGAGSSTQREV
jgi:hypothetical protein